MESLNKQTNKSVILFRSFDRLPVLIIMLAAEVQVPGRQRWDRESPCTVSEAGVKSCKYNRVGARVGAGVQLESLAFSVCRRSQLQALPDCVLWKETCTLLLVYVSDCDDMRFYFDQMQICEIRLQYDACKRCFYGGKDFKYGYMTLSRTIYLQ